MPLAYAPPLLLATFPSPWQRTGATLTAAFMRYALAVALLAGLQTLSVAASAQRGESTTTKDKPQATEGQATSEEKPSPWAGSILLFDQSATTQTLAVGTNYQSSNP